MGVNISTEELITHFKKLTKRSQFFGFFGYRKENLTELEKIRDIHRQYYFSLWSDHSESFGKKKEIKSIRVRLLEIENERPKATNELILSCFNFDKTLGRAKLSLDCEALFGKIKFAVNKRMEHGLAKSYEQFNSAIILFCAEFMTWLNQLSQCICSQSTLTDVLNRIDYLYAIEGESVFADESPSEYQIQTLIFEIRKFLEDKIVTRIKWKVENDSVREHFANLESSSEAFICYSINALVYLFSDLNSKEAKGFDIKTFDENINEKKHSFIEFQKTQLGMLLPLLSKMQPSLVQYSSAAIQNAENRFLIEDGRPQENYLKALLLQDEKGRISDKSGICPIMSNPDLIKQLIKTFGCLNELNLLAVAFAQAYKLSAVGGNIFLCHFLEDDSQNLLATFLHLISETKKSLMQIDQEGHELYGRYARKSEESDWRKKYASFKLKMTEIMKELKDIQQSTIAILECMEKVNSQGYREKIAEEVKIFQTIVSTVSKRVFHQQPMVERSDIQFSLEPSTQTQALANNDEKEKVPLAVSSSQAFFVPEVAQSNRTRELLDRARKLGLE